MTSKKLSFSQRNGYTNVKNIIQVESINDYLRTDLWNFLYEIFFEAILSRTKPHSLLIAIYAIFLREKITAIPSLRDPREERLEGIFFHSSWYKIYDFLEFFYNYLCENSEEADPAWFERHINKILSENNAGYRMIKGQITPITDENEIKTIQIAMDNSPYKEIAIHLKSALTFFSDKTHPDYRNSIKESISAVEVFCRKITETNTLGEALKKINANGIIIPSTIKEAVTKLYAFTNGKDGIRHALMDESEIEKAEAYFMLIACSCFINYLNAKQTFGN